MQRILFIKTSSMGDIIHHFAVVDDILRQFPNAKIDWVVEEAFADLVRCHQGIHQVIPVAIRRWRKALWRRHIWREIGLFKSALQQTHYDYVIDSQGLLKTAWITSLARCYKQQKHGFEKNSIRESLARFVCGTRHQVMWEQPAIERYRLLAAQSLGYQITGVPIFHLQPQVVAVDWLPLNISLNRCVVCLFATARREKYWQNHAWQQFANQLTQIGYHILVMWGSAQEHQLAQEIFLDREKMQLTDVTIAPRMSLVSAASVLNQAALVVSVDTGLGHLTSTMNTSQIMIFGKTDPKKYAPYWKANVRVLGDEHHFPSSDEVFLASCQLLKTQ